MFYNIVGMLIGLNLHKIQEHVGMTTLYPAVNYYEDVHTNFWNSIFHTAFMPVTMFGAFLWIPALFSLNPKQAEILRRFIMTIYITHFAVIDLYENTPEVTISVVIWYSFSYYKSIEVYKRWYLNGLEHLPYCDRQHLLKDNRRNIKTIFRRGLAIMVGALIIQEYFGHFIGGDPASRLEAVPNAILYACYYSVSHLRNYSFDDVSNYTFTALHGLRGLM